MLETLFLALALTTIPTHAAQLEGITFPDDLKVDGQKLVLNGMGLRTATLFAVRVYAAGLYVGHKAITAADILDQTTPKQLRMTFMRDVDEGDIRGAWDKTFAANCVESNPECTGLRSSLIQLQALMQGVKKGDEQVYTFRPKEVSYSINGVEKGRVSGAGFSRFLLSTWLGDHPPNESLRDGLLGARR